MNSNQQVNIGIQSIAADKLGDGDVGFLNDLVTGGSATLVAGDREASAIIERAINQVAILRGRLGAFEKNTLETNVNSLSGGVGKCDQQRKQHPRCRLRRRNRESDPSPDPDTGRHERVGDGELHAAKRVDTARQ